MWRTGTRWSSCRSSRSCRRCGARRSGRRRTAPRAEPSPPGRRDDDLRHGEVELAARRRARRRRPRRRPARSRARRRCRRGRRRTGSRARRRGCRRRGRDLDRSALPATRITSSPPASASFSSSHAILGSGAEASPIRRDAEVRQRELGDLPEGRCGDRAAVVVALRVVDDDGDHSCGSARARSRRTRRRTGCRSRSPSTTFCAVPVLPASV